MTRVKQVACVVIALFAGGCASHPSRLPPEAGLVSADRTPPAGAETAARPNWSVGDRFVFRRGGQQRIEVRVQSVDERSIMLVDEASGVQNRVDRDFGSLSLSAGDGEPIASWDPVDARFTWPLWVGKRWTCRYVRREGESELPVLAEYHCDAIETVTVPAGEFRTFRIWRRSRPLLEGEWLDRADLCWYAPEIGQVVRRLEDTVLTELEVCQRQ